MLHRPQKHDTQEEGKPESKPAVRVGGLPILPSTLEVPPESLVSEAAPAGAADSEAQEEAQQNWWVVGQGECAADSDAQGNSRIGG